MATNDSNGTFTATDPPPFTYFTIKELDISFGILYLLFGLFGIYSNGNVLWKFWKSKRTVRVYPFTLCALVLAANDLMFCTLGICPYAILILAGRPQASSFPKFLCIIFGYVNNFSDRFAWFTITCIMVFRCVTTVLPLKLRGVTYHPFIFILSFLASLQGVISILPAFDLYFLTERYDYGPNFGECLYGVDQDKAPWMIALIDALWWGPFLACILSCFIFFIFMRIHSARIVSAGKSNKTNDVKKKTALLTLFFIVCYLPKALLILFDFLINSDNKFSWEWLYEVMGDPYKALKLYVYMNAVCKFIIPAIRAAFTPTVLRLRSYLSMCDSSRRCKTNKTNIASPKSTMITRVSFMREKLFKANSSLCLKRNQNGNGIKTELKEIPSVAV
ncbi:hypothetical protein ACHWQZ_G006952 [Mnemiopsis leidyi]